MSFFLVTLEPDDKGNMVDVPIPDYGPYEKGSEAAKFAKTLTEQLGRKVQPRRIAQAADWRGRQAQRIAEGMLKPLPAKWDLPPIVDHFAHLHPADTSKIAFTENDELGVIDRVTILTPGRYISRFYSDVKDDHRRSLIASIDPSGEIFFATTPAEIARVYKEGPESCMDGDHSDFFDLPCWPTAPYGAGDLAVAYSMNNRGRIQSRSVCWPEKKLFGRVYGDIQRMTAALLAEGFQNLREENRNWKKFEGARLLKVPSGDPNEYVLPYFDDIGYAIDNGDHFITATAKPEGKIGMRLCHSGGSGGLAVMYRWCPRLKDFYEESRFQFVHGAEEEWSHRAIEDNTFVCGATKEIWPFQNRVAVRVDGRTEYWSTKHFDQHGEFCNKTGLNYPRDEMVTLSGGSRVHKSYRIDDAITDRMFRSLPYASYVDTFPLDPVTITINPDLHSVNPDEMMRFLGELTASQVREIERQQSQVIEHLIGLDGTIIPTRRVA